MQDPRELHPKAASNPKPRKKKSVSQHSPGYYPQGETDVRGGMLHPSSKTQSGNLRSETSPSFQQVEGSNSDSFADSSKSNNEYRALRRNYLLLEEESFSIKQELTEVEADVKNLEEMKSALLDQLVVLEGLVDPSELQQLGTL